MCLAMTDGALSCDGQCLSIVKNGTPRENPIWRRQIGHGECRGEKMRAEEQDSTKTRVTTHTCLSQVTTSETWNKNSPVDVHQQWPKAEIKEWLSQGSLSLSVQLKRNRHKEEGCYRGLMLKSCYYKALNKVSEFKFLISRQNWMLFSAIFVKMQKKC